MQPAIALGLIGVVEKSVDREVGKLSLQNVHTEHARRPIGAEVGAISPGSNAPPFPLTLKC